MFLIRSAAIDGYAALVSQLGGNPMDMFREAGFSSAQFRQPNSYISYQKTADLLDESAWRFHEPLFGLRLASRQSLLAIGEVALSGIRQPTLEDALSFARQHIYLHASGIHLQLRQRGESAEVSLSFDFTNPHGLLQLAQLSAAQLFNAIKITTGSNSPELHLHLQQSSTPATVWQPENAYGKVCFDSRFDGISFPHAWLTRKPQANEELLREHLQERMQLLKVQYPDNLRAQVSHLIGSLLPSGECNLDSVSNALGLHPRVLQKRLKAEGNSFSQLLQDTRMLIAQQNLLRDKISITDLALDLGYADVSVFSRHFKRSTGCSPRSWRQQQRNVTAELTVSSDHL